MYNRKFDVKKDFKELNELENVIIPTIDKMEHKDVLSEEENKYIKDLLKNYVREIFFNQFKK